MSRPISVIVGVGDGLSASLARKLSARGHDLVLAARRIDKLAALAAATRARLVACDVARVDDVAALFAGLSGVPQVVIYNPSYRVRGPLVDLDAEQVRKTLDITAFGGFLVAQAATRMMLPEQRGTILFTGASASVKGYAQSAPFAMGKFALRGLAQAMARELQPAGLHIAHVVIDGGIRSASRADQGKDTLLDPDAIADSYLHLIDQPRSAWCWEIELRPWVERF